MSRLETQVAIVGAGPAGLMLSHLLHLDGIHSVIVEMRSRQYCESRIRAGVLEQGTVDLLRHTGVGARLDREALVHRGIEIGFDRRRHRIPISDLTGGKCVTVYGQHEVVKDLITRRISDDGRILFDCSKTSIHGVDGTHPAVRVDHAGESLEITADFIAGCDGFHGVCREAAPSGHFQCFERAYSFGWLGILADAPPSSEELVYAHHERGFALFSMRSRKLTRLYLQARPDEDLGQWTDDRIWNELFRRFESSDGWLPNRGRILQKGIAAVRSFVCEPMQYKRLFLAGDAAHIVPPTGAKGMNLAIADVLVLSHALRAYYRAQTPQQLDDYSRVCLRRVWNAQRFSWWMTSLLHRFDHNEFDRRRQLAELDYLTTSQAAATALAENYVGLPFEGAPP
ncbi:MAG TPA: 4-hydroxybenzoate 3-monooxygenase [Terracidiphilus sp.]|nr:4-hydroxybenzoate 3-monooxygenase [Terracidiphilus sp.]